MAADQRPEDGPRATPGVDPREIEWPDDAAELRARERAEQARLAQLKLAPRALTAAVLGIGVVMLFISVMTAFIGDIPFLIAITWPIVAAGVIFALPFGLLLERVSATWRRGLPELAFLVSGLVIGITWTHGGLLALEAATSVRLIEDPQEMAFFRMVAGIFMGTAVASGFMAAKFWTEPLRRHQPVVYIGATVLALMTVASLVVFLTPGG